MWRWRALCCPSTRLLGHQHGPRRRSSIGLAAVIIGEVIFGKIFRNFALKLTAAVIGAIIYYIVMNFVLRMGLSTDDLKLLTALVVAVFLTIPYWKVNTSPKYL